MRRINYFVIILCLNSSLSYSCALKVGLREMPPYSFTNELLEWEGIDVDLFKVIASSVKCNIDFISVNFVDGLHLLNQGQIDAMSQLSKIDSRLKSIHFIGPIRNEEFTLITSNKVKESISSLNDISKLPYFFVKREGTYLGKVFEERYRSDPEFSSKFLELNSALSRVDLIFKGRVDGFFEETAFKDVQLTNRELSKKIKQHPLKLTSGKVYLGFSKKSISDEQVKMFNAALEAYIIRSE